MIYEVRITENNIVSIHHFNSTSFYDNKIASRLFFDEKVNELYIDNNNILIELFFVSNVEKPKLLIKNSLGLENSENRQIENSLLNETIKQVFEQKKLERDKTYSRNTFLDGIY